MKDLRRVVTKNKQLTIKDRYNGRVKNMPPMVLPKKQMYERNIFKRENLKIPQSIIKYAVKSDRSARMIEKENKLTLIVDLNATKPEIRKAAAELYGAKVLKVNTLREFKHPRKKAYVRFAEEGVAIEIAGRAGIL